jgi:hypothetical protein
MTVDAVWCKAINRGSNRFGIGPLNRHAQIDMVQRGFQV